MTANDRQAGPRVGSSVELHEVGGRSSLARIQAAHEHGVTVVLPFDTAVTASAEPAWAFDLTWPVPGGVAVWPVTVTERTGSAQVQVWRLDAVGEIRTEQRRHERRVPVGSAVTVTVYPDLGPRALPATQTDPEPLSGTLIDISASAAQCVVTARSDDAVLHAGTVATCEFALDDIPVALRGSLWGVWTAADSGQVRMVLQFDAGQPALADVVDYIGSVADYVGPAEG